MLTRDITNQEEFKKFLYFCEEETRDYLISGRTDLAPLNRFSLEVRVFKILSAAIGLVRGLHVPLLRQLPFPWTVRGTCRLLGKAIIHIGHDHAGRSHGPSLHHVDAAKDLTT